MIRADAILKIVRVKWPDRLWRRQATTTFREQWERIVRLHHNCKGLPRQEWEAARGWLSVARDMVADETRPERYAQAVGYLLQVEALAMPGLYIPDVEANPALARTYEALVTKLAVSSEDHPLEVLALLAEDDNDETDQSLLGTSVRTD